MAIIPDSIGQRPTPSAPTGIANVTPVDSSRQIAQAGMQVASIGNELQQAFDQEKKRVDMARAEEAFSQLRNAQIDLSYGEEGFMQKQGGDAIKTPLLKDYSEKFTTFSEGISERLDNEEQRQLFQQRARIAQSEYTQNILQHVFRESGVYQKQVFTSTAEVETRNAANNPNPFSVIASIQRVSAATDTYAKENGLDEVTAQNLREESRGKVLDSANESLIRANPAEYLKSISKSAVITEITEPKNYNASDVKPYSKERIQSLTKLINTPSQYDSLFEAAAKKYGLTAQELKFVAARESGLKPGAVGPKVKLGQSFGIMQVEAGNLERMGIAKDKWSDPSVNIDAGARLYADAKKRANGDPYKTDLLYYAGSEKNAGPNSKQYADNSAAVRTALDGKSEAKSENALYNMGTFDQQQRWRIMAERSSKENQGAFNADFDLRRGDSVSMAMAGKTDQNPLSVTDFQQRYPADKYGQTAQAEYQKYIGIQKLGAEISNFSMLPTNELQQKVNQFSPVEGPGFENQQKLLEVAQKAASTVINTREDHPVEFLLQNSATVKSAYQAMTQASNQPIEAQRAATERYIGLLLHDQQSLGIKNQKILDDATADRIVSRFMNPSESNSATKGQNAADVVGSLEAQYGRYWPDVYRQLSKDQKLPAEALVIPNVPSQAARAQIAAVAGLKQDALKTGLMAPDIKAMSDRVTSQLTDFGKTMLPGKDNYRTLQAYGDTAEKLALTFMQQGVKASDAAEKAINTLIGQYEIDGSLRIPRISPDFADTVKKGIRAKQIYIDPSALDVPIDLSGTRASSQVKKEWAAAVKSNAAWFANSNETGAVMYAKGQDGYLYPVLSSGKPVSYTWEELRQEGNISAKSRLIKSLGGK